MAQVTSGQVNTGSDLNSYFYVKWTRTGTWNDSTCGSYLKWELYLHNEAWWYSNALKVYSIDISGNRVYNGGTWSNYTSKGEHLLASGTYDMSHASDGTKTFRVDISAGFYDDGYASLYKPVSGSGTFEMVTIPRASSISSISNDKMVINGTNALTVNISRASSSFTHDVTFTFGTYKQSLTAQSTSAKLVIPLSWVGRFGNGGSGTLTGTVSVQTKSGATNIGSAVSKTFTLTCPSASSISSTTSSITINGSNKVTTNISRSVSSFVHKVVYTLGSKTQKYTSVGTSKEFTIPLAWISEFGNGGSGSKNATVTVTTLYGSQQIGSATSKTFTVNCPSASSIKSSTANIECNGTNKISVSINRSVSSFTHTVKYVWGNYSETKTGVGTSTEYAPPTSWLNAISSSNSGYGSVQVTTYYGSQQIGSTASARFDMTVPNYTPNLTSVTASLVQDSRISDWNIYVQKYSKAKFTFNGASGVYGSSISKYEVTIDGATYSGTANNYTSNVLNGSGTLNWTAKITDSRGKTNSKTGSISVQTLVTPKYVSSSMYRYDPSTQTENDESTQVYFKFAYSYETYGNRNSTLNKILIKRDGASSFTEYGTFTNDTEKIIDDYEFSPLYGYTIRVNVTDELGNSIQYEYYIASEQSLIDIDGLNNSIALLKQANKPNFVQIGGGLEVDGALINPQGTYAHYVNAFSGSAGYDKFATITIWNQYSNTPIIFEIAQRNDPSVIKVYVMFRSEEGTDPELESFYVDNDSFKIYIHKSATSTWDLYIYNDWWGHFQINRAMRMSTYYGCPNITWQNEFVSSLPSGYVEPEVRVPALKKETPSAGAIDENTPDIFPYFDGKESYFGSIYQTTDNKWYNVMSIRHRNGSGDGANYGTLFWTKLTQEDDLNWRKRLNNGWSTAKTILDSANFSNYAFKVNSAFVCANANDCVTGGMYRVHSTSTNTPVSGPNGMLLVFAQGSTSQPVIQLYIHYNGGLWIRMCWYGTWHGWAQCHN